MTCTKWVGENALPFFTFLKIFFLFDGSFFLHPFFFFWFWDGADNTISWLDAGTRCQEASIGEEKREKHKVGLGGLIPNMRVQKCVKGQRPKMRFKAFQKCVIYEHIK